MKFTKKTIYVGLFAVLYLIVAFSSFFHACAFFGLANNNWMSIILAFAFEVGQAAVLFSLLTSSKDRGRIMPWVLMTMFTLVQVIGNVYSSYKYIITNSVENLRYFKEPIFIWTDLPDAQANVIIVYLVGALLPIAALLLTSMITNYLTDQSEENNTPILVPEITSEKGPNPPIEIKDKEEFLNVYGDKDEPDGPPEGEGLSEHQEIENLNVALDKKDEEIDNLKKELEKLKNEKENEQQGLPETSKGESTTTEDKSDNDNGEQSVGTVENQGETERSITEDSEQENNEVHKSEDDRNIVDSNEQKLKPSHFINLTR